MPRYAILHLPLRKQEHKPPWNQDVICAQHGRYPSTSDHSHPSKSWRTNKRYFWIKLADFPVAQSKGSIMSSHALESPYDKLTDIFLQDVICSIKSGEAAKKGRQLRPSHGEDEREC
jgi:hypothetical protein